MRHLDAQNVGTRLLFAGNLIRQPYMKEQQYRVASELPVTDKVMRDTFWIGLWPGLGEDHLEHAASSIESYVRRVR
ncbi:DegT/DnrJ/EryC1/StrS aminotransferase family protein [compost metagenome]